MTPTQIDFAGRTVLLTGATRGIGSAATRQLLERGATVLAVARDQKALDELARTTPGRIHTLAADLSDPDMVSAVARWVGAEHPGCSVLINNAAMMVHTDLAKPPHDRGDEIGREVALNLTAPMVLAAALLPVLSGARNGAVVANVTSGLAISPSAKAAVYCATKSGLASFTKTLRYQCEDAGLPIACSEVVMTLVDTTLSRAEGMTRMPPEQAAREMLDGISACRAQVLVGKVRLLKTLWRLSPRLADRVMRGGTSPAA